MCRILSLFFTFYFLTCQGILEKTQDQYIWDMSSFYQTDDDWQRDYLVMKDEIKKFDLSDFQYTKKEGLIALLDKARELRSRAASLAIYGILMTNLDHSSELASQQYHQGLRIDTETEKVLSPLKRIILEYDQNRLNEWINKDQRFTIHEIRIRRILMETKHQVSEKLDQVLISYHSQIQHIGDNYHALFHSDLGWSTIDVEGESVPLNNMSYYRFRRQQPSTLKENVMRSYFEVLKKHQDSFANYLSQRILIQHNVAQVRGFIGGAEADFYIRDAMPETVIKTMISVAEESQDILERYIRIKKKFLKLNEISLFDMYTTIGRSDKSYSVKESMQKAYAIFGELDPSLQSTFLDVLEGNRLHLAATPNKNRMWGAYPPVGKTKPFTIMFHNNDFGSANRIMRAMMLNIIYEKIPETKISETRDDPPIYNNGVIYFGDILHYDHYIRQAETSTEKRDLVIGALDRLWVTFFKYAIAARFEKQIENIVSNGEKISGDRMSELYRENIKAIVGDELTISEAESQEWMTSTQSFYTYEHLYWAPAMAVGTYTNEKYQEGDERTKRILGDAYQTAQTDRSYHLLLEAGIDMNEKEVYRSVLRRMTNLMDELEKIQ